MPAGRACTRADEHPLPLNSPLIAGGPKALKMTGKMTESETGLPGRGQGKQEVAEKAQAGTQSLGLAIGK